MGARLARRRPATSGAAVVVVVLEARSCPMTTTTSDPVTPLTGTDVVSGCTSLGLTSMEVAIEEAAACCSEA